MRIKQGDTTKEKNNLVYLELLNEMQKRKSVGDLDNQDCHSSKCGERSKCGPCDKFPGCCSSKENPRALSVRDSDPQAVSLFTFDLHTQLLCFKRETEMAKRKR